MKQLLRLCAGFLLSRAAFARVALKVDTPMSPPAWALMERALLEANSRAVEAFAEKYIDARGYLLHTPRWGTLDGPDDAIETYFNWTPVARAGGSDKVPRLYKRRIGRPSPAVQGITYGENRAGSQWRYHKEFVTMSDWFHTAEGMRGFFSGGCRSQQIPLSCGE
jgi:hypothetical protein